MTQYSFLEDHVITCHYQNSRLGVRNQHFIMKLTLTILLLTVAFSTIQCQYSRDAAGGDPSFNEDDSDDFSEFENFDAEDDGFVETRTSKQVNEQKQEKPTNGKGQSAPEGEKDTFDDIYENDDANEDGVVTDDDDNEFEHFEDDEEFEGFSKTEHTTPSSDQKTEPKLTMAKVPMHFR